MRARNRSGSIGLDKRIKTWHFFWWENGKRRSKRIGTLSQYPTKASAWRAAKTLRDAVENQTQVNPSSTAPTVSTLVELYRIEKMPTRHSTRHGYNAWLKNHVIPKWGACDITDVQARPVELWLHSLTLAPKSRAAVRGLLRILWDFAMWRGDVPTQQSRRCRTWTVERMARGSLFLRWFRAPLPSPMDPNLAAAQTSRELLLAFPGYWPQWYALTRSSSVVLTIAGAP